MGRLAPTALPSSVSRFIGRRAEVAELRRLVGQHRLVTVLGSGGCGKTRLAIETAARARSDFPGGIAFAELAGLHGPEGVAGAVAGSLGLTGTAAIEMAPVIGDARLLIVVDNAEHVLDAVSRLVQDLLLRCPGLAVIVTSREQLHVTGEMAWRVPPMRLPPAEAPVALADIAAFDAVELFAARAAERLGGFRVDHENAALVASICRRLDGIPLALELVAARVGALGLAELFNRLDDGLRLLAMSSRAAVPRHQTLRATIDWSHELLDGPERLLLRRLAVFAGTFDLAAAEAVCADRNLAARDVADILQRLVDKCLLEPHPAGAGGLRYGMLQVIKQYALERLPEPEAAILRARHAAHYAAAVERLDADDRAFHVRGVELQAEYDNVRLALDWAGAHDPDLEVRTVEHLRWFWILKGALLEALQRTESALLRRPESPARRAALHADVATWRRKSGDVAGGAAHLDEAALLLDRIDDPRLASRVLRGRGLIRAACDDLPGAERDFLDAIALLDGLPANDDAVGALNNLARLRLLQGRTDQALIDMERAVQVAGRIARSNRPDHEAMLMLSQGAILSALNREEEAWERFLASARHAVHNGNRQECGDALQGLACVAARMRGEAACLELLAAARRMLDLAGASTDSCMVAHVARAERSSREALGARRAREAWTRGSGLDCDTVLERIDALTRRDAGGLLPRRKLEIVRLVADGLSNKEIAARLSISERTVEAHLDQLRRRFGLPNRTAMATWAISQGLVGT
jgi:predicted ATPase/DNA-binding CsgD family transcriptional regulator